jgi:hypothetical protein
MGVFGAMVLALIGVGDLARKEGRLRLTRSPLSASAADLSHRWGRTIFGGAGVLAMISGIISVAVGFASGIPWFGGFMALGFLGVIAVVAVMLYLVVVGPRVAYFAVARVFGRARPRLVEQQQAGEALEEGRGRILQDAIQRDRPSDKSVPGEDENGEGPASRRELPSSEPGHTQADDAIQGPEGI